MKLTTNVFLLIITLLPAAVLNAQTQPEVFNVTVYEGIYPDIMNAYGSNTSGATNHWLNQGLPVEGRRGSILFDPVYYLAHNADLRAAFGSHGYLAALQHFMSTGLPVEGRRGSLEFDVKYYLAHYPDLASFYGTNYLGAADHFLNWGLVHESRRGSADFSIQDYVGMYPDVSATGGAMSSGAGAIQWLQRGKALGRHGFGFLPPSTECSGGSTTEFATIPIPVAPATKSSVTVSRAATFVVNGTVSYINPPGSQTQLVPDGGSGAGHYSVSGGVYTFNSPDAEQPIQIAYNFNPIPSGYSRISFAHNRPPTAQGTLSDPLDASILDVTLRQISEGTVAVPNWETGGGQPYGQNNLVVCLNDSGVFSTLGVYDWVINVGHTLPVPGGFTVNKNWHLHGLGTGTTTLRLSAYLPNPGGSLPPGTGLGTVLGTKSDDSSGVEISDMTIDGNYPNLGGGIPVNLLGINLRSNQGGHSIHNVKVINTAGQIGSINESFEAFPVRITSINAARDTSNNNSIQYVVMDSFGGGRDTAIVVDNVLAEVAYNVVNGHENSYGGFNMPAVSFHDNSSTNSITAGFITDSGVNAGVHFDFNQIVAPAKYGIVVGGSNVYNNFEFSWNNITLLNPGATGMVFQGNVAGAQIARNNIIGAPSQGKGIHFTGSNSGNGFEFNQIGQALSNDSPTGNCAFSNWNEFSVQLANFPNTQSAPCF